MTEQHAGELARQLVQNAPDAVLVTDREGIIRLWNPGAETVFGYPAEEAVGSSLDIIIPERLRPRHQEGFVAVMATGKSRYGAQDLLSVPALRRDGSQISCEFSIAPIRDAEGAMIGMGAILRDVTARHKKEKALKERLAALEEGTK